MTKKQWFNIRTGTRVKCTSFDIDRRGEKPFTIQKMLFGNVVRINSNCSQCLVKWDGSGNEIWYGRMGIELE